MSSGYEVLTAIALVVIAGSTLVLAVLFTLVCLELRSSQRSLVKAATNARLHLAPLLLRVREMSDNIAAISGTVRKDVTTVSDTVDDASVSVRHAVALTEKRLHDLNALLDVVQGEAEHLFVTAASMVRGVRGGAAALRRHSGTDFASDELDAADEADDLDFQEESDGHHDDPESTAEASPPVAAPRIRPRARSRRRS